jgi:hypothetical protein
LKRPARLVFSVNKSRVALAAIEMEHRLAVGHHPSGRGLERSVAYQTVVFVEGICVDFDWTALGPMAILPVLLHTRYPKLVTSFGVDMVTADPSTADSFKLSAPVVDGPAGLGELNAPNPGSARTGLHLDVHDPLAHNHNCAMRAAGDVSA